MRQWWLLVVALVPQVALAGGFEVPDNTAEALGRAGAFTAKADNAGALQYNVAGLARQRGTRLLLDSNIILHDYEFTRAGVYPGDPNDPTNPVPYGGQPFPTVRNQGGPQLGPFLGVSTDFGIFDRWTFAIGVFGPSAYGRRNYGGATLADGRPNPARYDVLKADLLVVYPTLAAAVRATKWLDIGLALHVVVGHFDLSNTAFVDLGRSLCPHPEYTACDTTTTLKTTGATATFGLGFLARPKPFLAIGLNLRGPATINASGTAEATTPPVQPNLEITPSEAGFVTRLPWVLRLGVRYIFLKDGFEHGDIELDGTYEAWGCAQRGAVVNNETRDAAAAQMCGETRAYIPNLAIFQDINPYIMHRYRDTFSVRLGGAYNVQLPAGVLTLRLGFAFDSAATHYADTRLDFDTMAKYMPAVGLGYRVRGIAINIAYAYVYSPDRTVTSGDLRAINGVNGTTFDSTPSGDVPLPAVNNGHYRANSNILSVGINIAWDEALKRSRTVHWD